MHIISAPTVFSSKPSQVAFPPYIHKSPASNSEPVLEQLKPLTKCSGMVQASYNGYQVRSGDGACVAMSDQSFENRVPENLMNGKTKKDMSKDSYNGQNDDSDDDDDDDDNDRGGVVYSNQNPNEFMSNMNLGVDTSAAEASNTYTGLGIEDDIYMNELKDSEFGSNESITTNSEWEYQPQSNQRSENDIPELYINDNVMSDSESQPLLENDYNLVNEGSTSSSSMYGAESNYFTNEGFDYDLMDEPPIQSSKTVPDFNSYQDNSNSLKPFEATQSAYDLDRMASLNSQAPARTSISEQTIPNVKPLVISSQSHPELPSDSPLSPPPISTPNLSQAPESSIPSASKFPDLSSDYVAVEILPPSQQPNAEVEQLFGDMYADEDE